MNVSIHQIVDDISLRITNVNLMVELWIFNGNTLKSISFKQITISAFKYRLFFVLFVSIVKFFSSMDFSPCRRLVYRV